MWSKQFWADLAERAVKAAVWAAGAVILADKTGTLTGVDWLALLNVAGYALVASIVVNFAAAKAGVGAKDSASLLPASLDPPKKRKRTDKGDGGLSLLWAVLIIAAIVLLVRALL